MEEIIQETLKPLLELLHFNFSKIDIEDQGSNNYRINIVTDEANHLIGTHGNTLMAVQHILKILLRKKMEQEFSLMLDVDNYRKRQEENVITMTEQKVDEVRKQQKPQKLPPMSSYFRRIVHLHLTHPRFKDVATVSEGEGPYRAVIISPAWETAGSED
ncbi:MAG: jag protein, spoIIIJ-associated protein [Candidatus Peregrinibacteria bacterium GW2011_GWE2_39_6]|nr:MAG: jag protein, spoIIIJ-associated protein [Candidatus Peregrinibacteria bacterium GW2011_GWF2_39_17]KKR26418.1 MAG: jag protein, spoIIIJ-associated protein [Candidatus Peregrinibacteria bacterium GW2011_GWE2_39_6]HCW32169.1 hypothetical protein [Candidatus Peregrinibacteria bacterium]